MLPALALVLAVILGPLAGGQVSRLARASTTGVLALMWCAILQTAMRGSLAGLLSHEARVVLWAFVSMSLIILLLARGRRGLLLIAVGSALNAGAVLLNGYMPVGQAFVEQAGTAINASAGFYGVASSGTVLPVLGDVLKVELFGYAWLASAGDLISLIGAAVEVLDLLLERDSEESHSGDRFGGVPVNDAPIDSVGSPRPSEFVWRADG